MPKLIENLKENILRQAKTALLENGYNALTMRGVANACGVAVGTVYNYYPSKELLAASAILEDWRSALAGMERACLCAKSVEEGLVTVYDGVASFNGLYRAVWTGYTFNNSQQAEFAARHRALARQLAACLAPLLARFLPGAPHGTDVFFAENILICAGNSELTFEAFLPVIAPLLANNKTNIS